MNRRMWIGMALAALLLTLVGCGGASALPNRTAEAATGLGGGGGVGGGGVVYNGQFVEGLLVVGGGTASAEPEIAAISLGVELRGDDPAALVDEAAQTIEAVAAAAGDLGVAGSDVRTTGYNLWVETIYDPERGLPTGEVVYHVSHYLEVTLRDLEQVGALLAGAVDAGANSISSVNFTVEDPGALVDQARQEALADAAARAAQLADGLDVTLGSPISVMETAGGWYPDMMGMGGGGGMVQAPSISPGAFSVSVSVQVVYEIR